MSLLAPRRAHWVRPVDTAFDPGLCGWDVQVRNLPEADERKPVRQPRPAHQGARMLVKPPRSILDGFEIIKCSVGRFPDGSGRRRMTGPLAGPAFFLIAATLRLRERGLIPGP